MTQEQASNMEVQDKWVKNPPSRPLTKPEMDRTVKAAGKILGVPLPSLLDIYHSRLTRRATRIAGDPTHPANNVFTLLPSGRRLQSLRARTSVHILQFMGCCEMDDYKSQPFSFVRAGFNGEDLMTFDINSSAWIPQSDQAVSIKQRLDLDKEFTKLAHYIFTIECPIVLSEFLKIWAHQHTVLPKVYLLQKTPSSPVSCHATGFYPESAEMFWRRSEEEIHEGVEHGEILPNHDETFQMETVLNVSLFPLKDWGKYDCVFQLYGVSNDIIIPLDKTIIKTNQRK
ncbi:PREDICTED: T-cell surface glycoprotein CD1c-like [Cyprinodon variegatus]|uniref:T-cell surface glycoprotein CD1c-like n=1 Tax=Cyprinodon variegatus TaxID=28743 RepID=UPI000742C76D|nr:PREDICTED: T-cell surface glycoprotein CD1c-like [Cyprinodon variegatus]